MRSHGVGVASCLIGMLVTVAAVAGRSDAPQTRLRLFDVTAAHGVVDKRPFRPTHVFAPADNPIYVWFRGEGCITGTTIKSWWYYLDSDPPLKFAEGEVTVGEPDDWGQFNFELPPGKRWPLGEYRIELRVGDALLAETRFRVEARDTAASLR